MLFQCLFMITMEGIKLFTPQAHTSGATPFRAHESSKFVAQRSSYGVSFTITPGAVGYGINHCLAGAKLSTPRVDMIWTVR